MHPLETLMKEEIVAVKNSGSFTVKYAITCQIVTPTHVYGALFVDSLHLLRDYMNKFSDVLSITAIFGKGTIVHGILPYAKELEAYVTLKPLANVPEYVEQGNIGPVEYKYKAILYENPQDLIKANNGTSHSEQTSNTEDIGYLQFQLVNPVQEAIRTKTFGGVIRQSTGLDAIRAILTKYSKLEGVDTSQQIKGVDVQDGYSKEINEHILVPHLSPVIRVPKIIEELVGGIYSTGMQYYLQQSFWYIWSPYDTTRYGKDDVSMTVFNIPENKLAQIEKTFRVTNRRLIILSTGAVDFKPIEEKELPNTPPNVQFVDSRRILGGFGKVEENKLKVDGRQNYTAIEDPAISTHNTNHLAVESEVRITDNYLLEYGEMAKRRGALLQFTWENSVDNLIYPGMPLRFIYMKDKIPHQVYGTVIALDSKFQSESQGMMQRRFLNKTIVSCFVTDKLLDPTMQ